MAAALTSPDRTFISVEMSIEERAKTEILHTEIITALQWHLKYELKKNRRCCIRWSGFGTYAIAKYLRSADAKTTR